MILQSYNDCEFEKIIEDIGLKKAITRNKDVLIKINLASVALQNHPRTDILLLKKILHYIQQNGGRSTLAEGANGFLQENLITSGLREILDDYKVKIIDTDFEDSEEVQINGEYHYIPKCFIQYPVRLAIPAASKREGMLYSNNVKLFVGAVPRKMYQLTETSIGGAPRPRLHLNIDVSVANLFLAMQKYTPFHFYLNGGLAYNEYVGEFQLNETNIGDNALELDEHIYKKYFNNCEYPNYLSILKSKLI